MGYFFELDDANNTLRQSWDGAVSDELFLSGNAAWKRLLCSRAGVRGINDFSGVTKVDVSSKTIKGIAEEPVRGEENVLVVIVAPQDLIFGLSRMFTILTENKRPHRVVVRTMMEAYKALGMTDPQFKSIPVP